MDGQLHRPGMRQRLHRLVSVADREGALKFHVLLRLTTLGTGLTWQVAGLFASPFPESLFDNPVALECQPEGEVVVQQRFELVVQHLLR
jgi:hypothetical protein